MNTYLGNKEVINIVKVFHFRYPKDKTELQRSSVELIKKQYDWFETANILNLGKCSKCPLKRVFCALGQYENKRDCLFKDIFAGL